jgi:tight adherence protein B
MIIVDVLFIILSFVSASMLAWGILASAGLDVRSRFDVTMQQIAGPAPSVAPPTLEWEAPDRATAVSKLIAHMGWAERLQLQLLRAGWVMRPSEFLVYTSMGAIALGAAVLILLHSFLLVPLGFVVAYIGAYALLVSAQSHRNQMISAQLPDVLDMLAASVRAGLALNQGIKRAQTQTLPPLSEEFARTLEEVQLGRSLSDALETMVVRTNNYDLALVVQAVQTQLEVGGNMAEVLGRIATLIRERVKLQGEINIASAEGRLSAIILTGLPIGVGLFIHFVSPRYLDPMFHTHIGRVIFGSAAGLMILGVLLMRRLIAIKV